MRKFTLVASACLFSIVAFAGNSVPKPKTLNAEIKVKLILQVPNNKKDVKEDLVKQAKFDLAKYTDLKKESPIHFMGMEELMEANAKKTQRLDSIVGVVTEIGFKSSLQKFTYDVENHPLKSRNFVWNKIRANWKFYSENSYFWDNKGYCTEYSEVYADGTGTKYVRTYNADGLIGALTSYSAVDSAKWIPQKKAEYTYDKNGFIVAENDSYYVDSTSTWVPQVKIQATWNEKGIQLSYSALEWDGTQWTGSKDDFEYDDQARMTVDTRSQWSTEKNAWCNDSKSVNTYKDDKLVQEELQYWNKANQNWNGMENGNYNIKSEYLYDEQGRDTLQRITWLYADGWRLKGRYINKYSTIENGETNRVYTKLYYRLNEKGEQFEIPMYQYHYIYKVSGGLRYELDQRYDSSLGWINTQEDSLTFDKKDLPYELYMFEWPTPTSKRQGTLFVTYSHYDSGKIKEELFKYPDSKDKTQWVNKILMDWKYDQDTIQTSLVLSRWKNGSWDYDEERSYVLDYVTPISELLSWVDFVHTDGVYHKILTKKSKASGYSCCTYDYNYSQIDPSAVKDLIDEKKVIVYPNPVSDVLYINAVGNVEVAVYNIDGSLVKKTNEKTIPVSDLAPGTYLVYANGTCAKVIKK